MNSTDKIIEIFKNKSELTIQNYITALQQLQNALFQLEKEEENPEFLQDLSTRALSLGITIKLFRAEDDYERINSLILAD